MKELLKKEKISISQKTLRARNTKTNSNVYQTRSYSVGKIRGYDDCDYEH